MIKGKDYHTIVKDIQRDFAKGYEARKTDPVKIFEDTIHAINRLYDIFHDNNLRNQLLLYEVAGMINALKASIGIEWTTPRNRIL